MQVGNYQLVIKSNSQEELKEYISEFYIANDTANQLNATDVYIENNNI